MEILGFGVAIVMYLIWRAWTEAHGGDASPTGQWRSRTDAMSEYMGTHEPRFHATAGAAALLDPRAGGC